MTATGWAWLAAAGVLALVDWTAVAQGARQTERIAKPLVLAALLMAAVVSHPLKPVVHGWLIAALALGLVGDLALVAEHRPELVTVGAQHAAKTPRLAGEPSDRPTGWLFLAGLLAFLLGHLSYARAMQLYGMDRLSLAFGLLLVLITLLSFGYRILAGAHALGGGTMTVGVTLYMVALGAAVVLGVGTAQLWIAGGILLFAVSDLVLASDRFVQARPLAPVVVIISYHLAQALLLLGLLT